MLKSARNVTACDCRTPLAALEKELCLSRREVETLITAINSTMDESKRIERDLISIQVQNNENILSRARESNPRKNPRLE